MQVLGLIGLVVCAGAADDGLVAHWDFDEGAGTVLHDRSGNGNDGEIHGAAWVRSGEGHALLFDGENDYVNCGNGPSLDIRGPVTVQAWVRPTASNQGEPGIAGKFFESYAITYYGHGYWYISSGGNNAYGPLRIGQWRHIAGTFDGTTLRCYINGVEWQANPTKFDTVKPGGNFWIGCIVGDQGNVDPLVRDTGFFPGHVDSVRVHNRALTAEEIAVSYNLEAEEKGCAPVEAGRQGRFTVEPFFYPHENRAVVSVNFRWALPVEEGATLVAELASAGHDSPLRSATLNLDAPQPEDEAEFQLDELDPGAYELRVALREGEETKRTERLGFDYPLPGVPEVPAPDTYTAPALPPAVGPASYSVEVSDGGGFVVKTAGQTFRIESSYSYPHGGENRFVAGDRDKSGEQTWLVASEKEDESSYCVKASGGFYTIERRIELGPSRVVVKDTVRNISEDVVGILLSNHVNTAGLDELDVTLMSNPTAFVAAGNGAVGLIALDDLYHLQQRTGFSGGLAFVRMDDFGLAADDSYVFEWAVYPTATRDYYDFISQVRKDEGINRRVEGAFGWMDRRAVPARDFLELQAVKYVSIPCLGFPPDDPTVSLEGFEFPEYPQECAALKRTMGETTRLYPDVKVMFHVAHSLYATGDPDGLFPDSRAIDVNGNQLHYGPNSIDYYGRYFSKERFDEGWRWWLFYPTMENRFGKAMIEAMEFMVDELGASAMWADGYISGYVRGGYSYDRWDGLSVTIDPETKLVTRKKVCVPYVSLPVLKTCARILSDRGGVLVTNGQPGPRSFWQEDVISSGETGGGDQTPIGRLHLGRSVTPLGNPLAIKNRRDVYRDMLTKLDYGALYFWYGDQGLMDHKTLINHMYPITFESIHAGTVRGKERIVTKQPGVYGWHGDRALHMVHLCDARGALVPHGFVTTVDTDGVRTELPLEPEQSAAVVRVPITVESPGPTNVRVTQYDESGILMTLNGVGEACIVVTDGAFPVGEGDGFIVQDGRASREVRADAGGLAFATVLDGPVEVCVD